MKNLIKRKMWELGEVLERERECKKDLGKKKCAERKKNEGRRNCAKGKKNWGKSK